MAKVHFVKDGLTKQETSSTASVDISAEQVEELFSGYDYKFTEMPPRINPENLVNDFSAYRHVVLEIEPGEHTESFPKVGYYFIPTISTDSCREMLNNPNLPDR